MTNPESIDPQRVLILGAGPGLGAALARRFGREGFAVTLVGRREESLAALAEELRGAGVTVDTATADASDPHGFQKAVEELSQRVTPGVVVYNAALLAGDGILTSDTDYLTSAHAVNVLGAITAAQVFSPAMRQAGAGTILVTGGGLALAPHPAFATLSIGKAGLRAAVSLLHDELKADGVHVAGVTIAGAIAPATAFAPDLIAETYWALHTQPATEWSAETLFDGH